MISPKFSHADLAGVAGLIAFLADPEACKARLAELVAEANAAHAARSDAQAKINEELELQKTGAAKMAEVEARFARLAVEREALEQAQADLATRDALVRARELAANEAEASIAARKVAQAKADAEQAERLERLVADEAALANDRAEHAKKLEALRALAG